MSVLRRNLVFRSSCLFSTLASLCLTMAATPAAAQSASSSRPSMVVVSVGAGQQSASAAIDSQWTTTIYAEPAEFDARYTKKGGGLFDIGGAVRIWRDLFVGAAVTSSSHTHGVEVSGRIPHPLRFGAPRDISGTVSDLERSETGAHVQLMWRRTVAPRVVLTLMAGPSSISVKQDLVETVSFDETYPYDSATLRDVQTTGASGRGLGFNVGADVTFKILRQLGVGVQARRASATADLEVSSTNTVSVKLGGTQVSGGVRFEF